MLQQRRDGHRLTATEWEAACAATFLEIDDETRTAILSETDGLDAATDRWAAATIDEAIQIRLAAAEGPELAEHVFTWQESTQVSDDFLQVLSFGGTADEIRAIFRALPAGKTGGALGATREHFVYAPDEILLHFAPIIDAIFKGKSPDMLRLGVISPLTKSGGRFGR